MGVYSDFIKERVDRWRLNKIFMGFGLMKRGESEPFAGGFPWFSH